MLPPLRRDHGCGCWPSDDRLVRQIHLLNRPDPSVTSTRPVYMVFDCLYERGRDLRMVPLEKRSAVLEEEIAGCDLIHPARRLPDHGLEAWDLVKRNGWEGLVAKNPAAPYVQGPTRRWLKVKVRHEGTFVVGGVTRSGSRVTRLLVGARKGRRLF